MEMVGSQWLHPKKIQINPTSQKGLPCNSYSRFALQKETKNCSTQTINSKRLERKSPLFYKRFMKAKNVRLSMEIPTNYGVRWPVTALRRKKQSGARAPHSKKATPCITWGLKWKQANRIYLTG